MSSDQKTKYIFVLLSAPEGKRDRAGRVKSFGVPLCGTDSGRAVLGKPVGRAVSLDFAGGGANLGQRKSLEHHSAPGLCLWQERSVSIANCYGITKKGGGVCGRTAGFCHTWSEAEVPAAAGTKRKRHLSVPFFFWCGRWDSNPHTEVLASKTRASTIPPLPLISLWPCAFTKQQADKYPYYTIFSLALSIPRPVPTVRGLPVYRRCVRIES